MAIDFNKQFRYFYTSYMENYHGIATYMPHAKLFHPTVGFPFVGDGAYFFKFTNTIPKILTFSHKIKVFFPQIKEGVIRFKDAKYRVINKDNLDDVEVDYSVITDTPYRDYLIIKDHIVDVEIRLNVKRKYYGLMKPVEILCDKVTFEIFNQQIEILTTSPNILLIPYTHAHPGDAPLYACNYETLKSFTFSNKNLEVEIGMLEDVVPVLEKYGFKYYKATIDYNILTKYAGMYYPPNIVYIREDALNIGYIPNTYSKSEVEKNIPFTLFWDNNFSDQDVIHDLCYGSYYYTAVYDKFDRCVYSPKCCDLPNCKENKPAELLRAHTILSMHLFCSLKLSTLEEHKPKSGPILSNVEYLEDIFEQKG